MTHDESKFLDDYSRFLESTGRHLTYAAISAYRNFNDELSEKEKQFLKDHIDLCELCSARLAEIEEVEGSVVRPAAVFRISPVVFRYAMAATIVLAVGIASALYLSGRNQQEQPRGVSTGEQSLAASSRENFEPNEMLENFVGRTMRSGARARFVTPQAGDTIIQPLTFRWEGGKAGDINKITVTDNKNVEVWRDSTIASHAEFTARVKPGLYYSKLEVNGKLVAVGKFFVARTSE